MSPYTAETWCLYASLGTAIGAEIRRRRGKTDWQLGWFTAAAVLLITAGLFGLHLWSLVVRHALPTPYEIGGAMAQLVTPFLIFAGLSFVPPIRRWIGNAAWLARALPVVIVLCSLCLVYVPVILHVPTRSPTAPVSEEGMLSRYPILKVAVVNEPAEWTQFRRPLMAFLSGQNPDGVPREDQVAAWRNLVSAIYAIAARASDREILDVAQAEAALLHQLGNEDRSACARQALGAPVNADQLSGRSSALNSRFLAEVQAAVRHGLSASTVALPVKDQVALVVKAAVALPSNPFTQDEAKFLTSSSPQTKLDDPNRTCRIYAKVYDNVLQLAPEQGTAFFRYVFASGGH